MAIEKVNAEKEGKRRRNISHLFLQATYRESYVKAILRRSNYWRELKQAQDTRKMHGELKVTTSDGIGYC